jgi:hypothetical protein
VAECASRITAWIAGSFYAKTRSTPLCPAMTKWKAFRQAPDVPYSRDQQCDGAKEPRPFTRTPSATYRWNARRRTFVTTSMELEKAEHEADYGLGHRAVGAVTLQLRPKAT